MFIVSMNNEIKLILMDMDGTLLNSAGKIPEGNKRALRAASEAGVRTTIVTGRMLRATTRVAGELELNAPLVTYNGALITDSKPPYKIKSHNFLLDENSKNIISMLRRFDTHINAYIDDNLFVEKDSPQIKEYSRTRNAEYRIVDDFNTLPELNCTKLLIIEDRPEIMNEIKNFLLAESGAEIFQSAPNFCEVLPKDVNKGTALEFLADYYGIRTSQVMAIGDQENDIPMIQKAGVGVAMGNSRAETVQAADETTLTNDESGVAAAIARHLPWLKFRV